MHGLIMIFFHLIVFENANQIGVFDLLIYLVLSGSVDIPYLSISKQVMQLMRLTGSTNALIERNYS